MLTKIAGVVGAIAAKLFGAWLSFKRQVNTAEAQGKGLSDGLQNRLDAKREVDARPRDPNRLARWVRKPPGD